MDRSSFEAVEGSVELRNALALPQLTKSPEGFEVSKESYIMEWAPSKDIKRLHISCNCYGVSK
jgi:hypothetical protein